jgi:hypothetical protein
VIVGGPVWGGRIASPVRTYLRQHGSDFRSTAFFVTQGGAWPGISFKQMAAMNGKQPHGHAVGFFGEAIPTVR